MDYLIDFTLFLGPGHRGDAERADATLQARLSARRELEQSLGGSAAHVLRAWLDCMASGGVPELCGSAQGDSAAQLRWRQAQTGAIVAAHRAVGLDLDAWPADAAGEFWEHAHFSLAVAVPEQFRARETWIDEFLGRLRALDFSCRDLMTPEYGDTAFGVSGAAHPIFAADEVYLDCDPSIVSGSRGVEVLPTAARAAYLELAAEVAAQARAKAH